MKKIFKLLLILLCLNSILYAQEKQKGFYFLQLKDKNNTEFSLNFPSQYLSEKSIARRAAMNISIDSTDLPVNSLYINQIRLAGAEVFSISKWQNGVTARIAFEDTAIIMPQLRNFNFISKIEYTGLDVVDVNILNSNANINMSSANTQRANYGDGLAQLLQLNGKPLHDMGFRGAGIVIAVIDGGFINANTHIAFDSLRLSGRLLGTHDFAYRTDNVFCRSTHGASVLSTLASNVPNYLIGTAPDAQYWLLISERIQGEYPVEADLWISAAEFADSVGADIITSSLGYTVFSNSKLNFSYQDMNGQTVRVSRAACQAAEKGIVVFNSAGNDGLSEWHYIGAPADAMKIITVGSVNAMGKISDFSSFGPTADGRIKPELCAMGYKTAVADCTTNDQFTNGSGTSFATPVLAGMTACLLQALKANNIAYSSEIVQNSLKVSASIYPQSTAQEGFGIPNFENAYNSLMYSQSVEVLKNEYIIVRNEGNNILINFKNKNLKNNISIFNATGQILYFISTKKDEIAINKNVFSTGILFLKIENKQFSCMKKIIN